MEPRTHSHTGSVAEPRLWVPGVAYASGAGDLHIGPSVGYRSRDPSFAGLRCGWGSRVTEWTHSAWVVPRSDLSDDVAIAHGVVFPESLIDQSAQPHAHRWLREQPLVAVSGTTWARLVADGARLCRVAFDATGDRLLRIDMMWPAHPPSSAAVAEEALHAATTAVWGGRSLLDAQGDPSAVDRLLRWLSNGIVDEAGLLNAVDARRLVEDGYGYRGARDGWFRTIDDFAHDLGPVDATFEQVFKRADRMRPDAEELAAAIRACASNATELDVAGRAVRAIAVPAIRLADVDRLVVDGDELTELVLAAERRWSLCEIDDWSPRAALERDDGRARSAGRDTV